jgi:hypothetical protein
MKLYYYSITGINSRPSFNAKALAWRYYSDGTTPRQAATDMCQVELIHYRDMPTCTFFVHIWDEKGTFLSTFMFTRTYTYDLQEIV